MTLPTSISSRLRLPLIAAPMTGVSNPELVIAACAGGVVGAFPTRNARANGGLDQWLTRIVSGLAPTPNAAPWCPNIVIHQDAQDLREDIELVLRHRAEMVITSVGSPAAVIGPLHEAGVLVFSDVATIRHAHRALEAGADGLVLLTAGAGGHTGWLNGLAFVRAVRAFYRGPLVLAGGVSDGASLLAAQALGCDLAYIGTRFIATVESMAKPAFKQAVVEACADDVVLTRAVNGIPLSVLAPSLRALGLDPASADEALTPEKARELFSQVKGQGQRATRKEVWSAGHAVSGVDAIRTVADLITHLNADYHAARQALSAAPAWR